MNAGWIPPWRQTSVAPRSQASRERRTISSSGTRYGRAAQVRRQPALRERAEAAAEVADVRVLDVPRHDVADLVAADLAPEPVGRGEDALPLLAARAEEAHELLLARARRSSPPAARRARRRRGRRRSRRDATASSRASPSASEARSAVGQHLRVEPGAREVAGIDREPRDEREPARARRRRQPLELGPGRLGVDVVDRHRRDAAPVVDPGVEEAREVVVGQVRRRLHRHVVREQEPRRRDRPEVIVEGRLRMRRHARARLRAEVLDDHLLQVAVPLVQRRAARRAPRAAPPASRRSRSGSRS